MSSSRADPRSGEARYAALDWLRAMATLGVFVFHSGAPYVARDWHFSSESKSFALTIWNASLLVWIMPLFFTISGASMGFALRIHSPCDFVVERLRRLLVPLLFGIFVMAPPQVYVERLSRHQFECSFLAFYPHYFNAPYLEIGGAGNFAWMGLHLWYLQALLIMSLLCLPLFLVVERNWKAQWSGESRRWLRRPATMFLLALPIGAIEWLFGNVGLGGWNMLAYPIFFAYGFILAQSPTAINVVKRSAPLALPLAVFATILLLWRVLDRGPVAYAQYDPRWLAVLYAFAGWCWVVALVGLAYRFFNRGYPALSRLSKLLLPIYILHQTVIVIIAYLVYRNALGVFDKYLMVLSSSAMVAILLCAGVIGKFRGPVANRVGIC